MNFISLFSIGELVIPDCNDLSKNRPGDGYWNSNYLKLVPSEDWDDGGVWIILLLFVDCNFFYVLTFLQAFQAVI